MTTQEITPKKIWKNLNSFMRLLKRVDPKKYQQFQEQLPYKLGGMFEYKTTKN